MTERSDNASVPILSEMEANAIDIDETFLRCMPGVLLATEKVLMSIKKY